MRYTAKRLQEHIKAERGNYTELATKMQKYKKARANASKERYSLVPFFKDGHNITLSTLTALMRETGKSIDFFVEFESNELPQFTSGETTGNSILALTINHQNEIIRLKDELITDKERIIKLKDTEIEQWKQRYTSLLETNKHK